MCSERGMLLFFILWQYARDRKKSGRGRCSPVLGRAQHRAGQLGRLRRGGVRHLDQICQSHAAVQSRCSAVTAVQVLAGNVIHSALTVEAATLGVFIELHGAIRWWHEGDLCTGVWQNAAHCEPRHSST